MLRASMLRDMKAAFGQDDLRMRLRRQKSSAVEDITAEWPAEFDLRTALLEAATANWEAELADRPNARRGEIALKKSYEIAISMPRQF